LGSEKGRWNGYNRDQDQKEALCLAPVDERCKSYYLFAPKLDLIVDILHRSPYMNYASRSTEFYLDGTDKYF